MSPKQIDSVQTLAVVKLVTLTDFIEQNQRMIAVIGVLSALGIYWGSNPVAGTTSPSVPFFCMLSTLPLYWEIAFSNFDASKSRWSVIVFVNLFSPIMIGTIWYALLGFPDDREKQLPWIITLVFLVFAWQSYKKLDVGSLPMRLELRWNEFIIKRLNEQVPLSEDKLAEIRIGAAQISERFNREFRFLFASLYLILAIFFAGLILNPLVGLINLVISDYSASYLPPDRRRGPDQPVLSDNP